VPGLARGAIFSHVALFRGLLRAFGPLERPGEILGQRRDHLDALAPEWMLEGEPRGMKELALEAHLMRASILGVTAHRMPDRLQVNPDLVSSPGLQTQAQKRGALESPLEREMRTSLAGVQSPDRHARADAGIAPDGGLDRPRACRRTTLNQSQVLALDPSGGKRGLQSRVGLLGAGHDEQPGGVLVQPVNDARAIRITPGRALCQKLGERGLAMPARRVDDQAGPLVDHQ
jgi:hypothetical protein